jgi:diguanylate cyclase (GGDEF)-like protein
MAIPITQLLHQELERLLRASGAASSDGRPAALDKEVETIFRDIAGIRMAANNSVRRWAERLSKNELLELQSSLDARLDEWLSAKISKLVERREALLVEQAERDPVTELPNRAAFNRKLRDEIERARRYDREFCLVLFDVDRFKSVNDRFGHPAGDQTLAEIARMLKSSLRQSDAVFRYGGDEFAAICPETSGEAIDHALRRLKSNILMWRVESSVSEHLDLSWGVASFPVDSVEEKGLISRADERLYACKLARPRDIVSRL